MGLKLLLTIKIWLYKYRLSSLKVVDRNTLDLWVKLFTFLSKENYKAPTTQRMELPYKSMTVYLTQLAKLPNAFERYTVIEEGYPQSVLLEDWFITDDSTRFDLQIAIKELSFNLRYLSDVYHSCADTDYANSILEQHQQLLITVEKLATVAICHMTV